MTCCNKLLCSMGRMGLNVPVGHLLLSNAVCWREKLATILEILERMQWAQLPEGAILDSYNKLFMNGSYHFQSVQV